MPAVVIPSSMLDATSGRRIVDVAGGTVKAVLTALWQAYPDLKAKLLDEEGAVHAYLAVVVDGAETEDLRAPVSEESEVVIVPSIGGGRGR